MPLLKALLEVQIYNLETSYLTDTAAHGSGNIIHGFEGYLKNQPGGRKKYEISEQDRIFSVSSQTYKKVRSACFAPAHTDSGSVGIGPIRRRGGVDCNRGRPVKDVNTRSHHDQRSSRPSTRGPVSRATEEKSGQGISTEETCSAAEEHRNSRQ